MWVLGVVGIWVVVASGLALLIGRGIRVADERSYATGADGRLTTADLPASFVPDPAPAPTRTFPRRGPVPLPPVGVALVVVVLGLQTAGFVTQLVGATGALPRLLSMDGTSSVSRMVVSVLFAVAAVAAIAAAGVQSGRRAWWLAVAMVAGSVAVVKAAGTLHADAMAAASATLGVGVAFLLSMVLAALVVGALWFLSRDERRDRLRVLGALSAYAFAVVALSALSSAAAGAYGAGSRWAFAATYLEESGEGLAAVAYLMAVLVAVAPQLVLPPSWALRRQADTAALEAGAHQPDAGRWPSAS